MNQAPMPSIAEPSYVQFFGLERAPFDHLPDSEELFPSEQYSLLFEHLENVANEADALLVICGADGSGKTTLINRFLGTTDEHLMRVVVDPTCRSADDFYTSFLTQIGFEEISGSARELRNITKEFLVCRGMARDHVLVVIDNAHQTPPVILEQLRLLCELKVKDVRALSVVLSGNSNIVRVVDAPAMRKIKFRHYKAFSLRSYTEEETDAYIRHRLSAAGCQDSLAIPEAASLQIHRYAGGTPMQIDSLCDELLKEAFSLQSHAITEELVQAVAERLKLLPMVTPLDGRRRRKSDPESEADSAIVEALSNQTGQFDARIAQLSGQLQDLRSDKARALKELEDRNKALEARNRDLAALQEEQTSRTAQIEALTLTAASSAEEVERASAEVAEITTQLKQSEERALALADKLENATRSHDDAKAELNKSNARIDQLTDSAEQTQMQLDQALAELAEAQKLADERVAAIEQHETDLAKLQSEIETGKAQLGDLQVELGSRDQAIAQLSTQLEKSQEECRTAYQRIETLRHPEEVEEIEKTAQEELGKARSSIEELRQQEEQLKQSLADSSNQIDNKSMELDALREELELRNDVIAELRAFLDESQKENESAKSLIAELKSPDELAEAIHTSEGLTADLKQEASARASAEKELSEVKSALDETRQVEKELRATVHELSSNLRDASERALRASVLEKNVVDLKKEIAMMSLELEMRNDALGELETQLEAYEEEYGESKPNYDEPREHQTDTEQSEGLAAETELDKLFDDAQVYRTLRICDPDSYARLNKKYATLARQDLPKKKLRVEMRIAQAKLMEERLAKASDSAIVAYAGLVVHQLSEYIVDGKEPCLSLLVPKGDPADLPKAKYSSTSVDLEFDALDTVLRTYSADRLLPEEDDAWPNLEPVFAELLEEFGAENVAAIENSYDPNVDRREVCKVSKALYTGILKLPREAAANAIRWMLTAK